MTQELDTLWLNGSKKETKMKNQIIEMPVQSIQPAPSQQAASLLSIIEKVATTADADITKMQAVLDMYNQQVAREREYQKEDAAEAARQKFAADFVPMSAELPLVIKNKKNAQTHSTYAELADINQEIRPILGKYGFSISTDITKQTKESVTVVATLSHKDGHEKFTEITLPLDGAGFKGNANKTDIQAIASSISYAKRIAICARLNISTGDDKDGNKIQEEPLATDSQRTAISGLYKKLTEVQQDSFNERTGGILAIKKKDVDTVIALLNKSISEKK